MTKIAEHLVDVCRLISRPVSCYRSCRIITLASFAYCLDVAAFGSRRVYQRYAKGAKLFRDTARPVIPQGDL